ncbi:hypothetical protein JG688_00004946 [Phytophthora aleatoria]|uniref:Uncharacterized protein n=1 Tax=Phytophthora aleatoria TaxID=2496075 RepID=A0A8J5IQD5_9STRA|nr:hypothetical protein JG688_00004946 [Phytophthora aleatoria]
MAPISTTRMAWHFRFCHGPESERDGFATGAGRLPGLYEHAFDVLLFYLGAPWTLWSIWRRPLKYECTVLWATLSTRTSLESTCGPAKTGSEHSCRRKTDL